VNNPWRFSSKRTDSESGYVYFGRRYYDPVVGRWLTQDPLGVKAGPNLYAYVLNCPITSFDLYGLEAEQRGFLGQCLDTVRNFIGTVRDFFSTNKISEIRNIVRSDETRDKLVKVASRIKENSRGAVVRTKAIAHGTIDFGISTAHGIESLCHAVGTHDMDLDYRERLEMNINLNRSQWNREVIVASWIQEKLGVNPNDATYQKWRNRTHVGLEVASLVSGGYGLARGGVSIFKASRSWTVASRLASKTSRKLTRSSIKEYLKHAGNLNREQIVKDLNSIGLRLKGKSPDSRFMEFIDKGNNLRVKIHPADRITKYNHLHIYDKSGRSLSSDLQIVLPNSPEAHIQIGEILMGD